MAHADVPLKLKDRRRLIERCQSLPLAHIAADGIPRATRVTTGLTNLMTS